ncbi:Protein of unknown function DUF86 [Modestobacter sp. DSM 44400]|nr:Protein of unknown function DUF86 [Modestobacter sp. DSM 44400]
MGPPGTNAETMRVLGRHGVLSSELAETMAAAVGYRNVLVHQYVDVDHSVTIARLAEHDALQHFARSVADFLAEQ